MGYTPSLKPNTRIDIADILRGIAIGGIVLIHFIEQLNFYKFPPASSDFMESLNQGVWDTTFFLLASKMYAIFSMLFGLSFFIQHDNQAQQGKDFRPRFLWRMVLLFMWGLFDLLFYNGDILTVYAVCGVLVVPFIRANNKVLVAATIFFALTLVFDCISGFTTGSAGATDGGFKSLMLTGAMPRMLQSIFALLSAFYFLLM